MRFKNITYSERILNRLIQISKETIPTEETTISLLKLKIEKNENFFFQFFSEYESLENHSFFEKTEFAIDLMLRFLIKNHIYFAILSSYIKRFEDDFRECWLVNKEIYQLNQLNEIKEFQNIFKDKLYEVFTPKNLSEYNLIYETKNDKIEIKTNASASDLVMILVVLEVGELTKYTKRKNWNIILKKCLFDSVSESFFSPKFNDYKRGSVINEKDEERIKNIKSFLNKYVKID